MKRSERNWVTVFLLCSMAFLSAVFAVQGTLLSTMIERFQLDTGNQGMANFMTFLGGILALLCTFMMLGKQKKRTLLKVALLICVSGLLIMTVSPTYLVYVMGWFIVGFGLGMMDALLSACMADLYEGKMAVIMMCMLHTSNGLASVLSPMLYTHLLSTVRDWKMVYLVIALMGLGILLCALGIGRCLRIADPESLSDQAMAPKQILPTLYRSRLLWLTAAIFFHGIFLSGLNTWVNRYADTLQGGDFIPAQSCVFIGLMLSRLLMPFLPVKQEKYVVASGLLGSAFLAAGLIGESGVVLRICAGLSSLMFGAMIPCVITLCCNRQRENTLLATTGIMLALYLGQGVSSPLIAALEGAWSLKAGMGLCAVCMVLGSLCCVMDQVKRSPK